MNIFFKRPHKYETDSLLCRAKVNKGPLRPQEKNWGGSCVREVRQEKESKLEKKKQLKNRNMEWKTKTGEEYP